MRWILGLLVMLTAAPALAFEGEEMRDEWLKKMEEQQKR
jgi:hypothetical protein